MEEVGALKVGVWIDLGGVNIKVFLQIVLTEFCG